MASTSGALPFTTENVRPLLSTGYGAACRGFELLSHYPARSLVALGNHVEGGRAESRLAREAGQDWASTAGRAARSLAIGL